MPAPPDNSAATIPSSAPPPREKPPGNPAAYRFVRRIGAGAYGSVWLAEQRNTGKMVAVKFYHLGRGADRALPEREVEKLAALYTERDIVQLIDVDWNADPPYFVMEYLENGSLEDLVREGPLSVPEALRMVRSVAAALVHAHGRGVLHCDLKPANVLLDHDLHPRLADFGQSRLHNETDAALGTFFYMAPEQASLTATPDARWDVYALGALMYCLLTGLPPFRNDSTRTSLLSAENLENRLALYRKLIDESPRPTAHRHVRGMDGSLADIIDRCLAVRPSRRFPNAQAVLTALDERAARRARRPVLILGAVGPMLLMLVMGLFAWRGLNTTVARTTEVLTERMLESDRFASQFVAETAAREVDRRWQIMEQESADPDLRAAILACAGKAFRDPDRQKLQNRLERIKDENADAEATSWVLNDAEGRQLARAPFGETVDLNFRFRDYFHGQGRDFAPEAVPADVGPVKDSHRSLVFESRATGNRIVAFSSPVWSAPKGEAGRRVIGVMSMTVELGRFGELRPDENRRKHQIAVLVDTRADWTGRKGLILQHPKLAEMLARGRRLPEHRLPEERVIELEKLRRAVVEGKAPPEALTRDIDYHDPVEGVDADRSLATLEPVIARGRDTGWVVMVQEKYSDAVAPVGDLKGELLTIGLWALGIVAGVLTLLWALVIRAFNDSPAAGSGRHGAGTGDSAGTGSGSARKSVQPDLPPTIATGAVTQRTVRQGEGVDAQTTGVSIITSVAADEPNRADGSIITGVIEEGATEKPSAGDDPDPPTVRTDPRP